MENERIKQQKPLFTAAALIIVSALASAVFALTEYFAGTHGVTEALECILEAAGSGLLFCLCYYLFTFNKKMTGETLLYYDAFIIIANLMNVSLALVRGKAEAGAVAIKLISMAISVFLHVMLSRPFLGKSKHPDKTGKIFMIITFCLTGLLFVFFAVLLIISAAAGVELNHGVIIYAPEITLLVGEGFLWKASRREDAAQNE